MGSCEDGKLSLGSTISEEYLAHLKNYWLLKERCSMGLAMSVSEVNRGRRSWQLIFRNTATESS